MIYRVKIKGEKMNETLEGYKAYLNRRYSEGSRMASSCLYVIERIGKILNHVPAYAYIPDDFTKIKNLELLQTLYEYVKDEQKKNGGIFNGSTLSKGYWGKSFCSSAIKNYMDYLIETYDGVSSVGESHITLHTEEIMQKITYGAPGTGKSHKTKDETDKWKDNVFRTTFHPDSDYSTFVGAYKPSMSDDAGRVEVYKGSGASKVLDATHEIKKGISYEFIPQAFIKAYVLAWKKMNDAPNGEDGKPNPEPVFLVIEEINRGNCAQIFGDIFQLLDRNDAGYSEYPIDADSDLKKFLSRPDDKGGLGGLDADAISIKFGVEKKEVELIRDGKHLMLPPNLLIRATMNTSDQSLFPMDSAFKRRWDWEYVPLKDAGKGWKIKFSDCEVDWWKFLVEINKIVKGVTNSADKQLGYFFVKAKDSVIDAEMFVNKVAFYLWNDVFKDCELDGEAFKIEREGGEVDVLAFQDFFKEDGTINEEVLKNFLTKLVPQPEPENDAAPQAGTGA